MKIYSLVFLILFQFPFVFNEKSEPATPKVASIVYKSTDGGKTWQDISEGLPEIVGYQDEGVQLNSFFADDRGLYLSAGNWMYHNKQHSSSSSWSKEILPNDHRIIASDGTTGVLAYDPLNKDFLRKTMGEDQWTSTYETFQASRPMAFLETTAGTIFIGTDRRLFRSHDAGKSWTQVDPHGWILKLIESDGIVMAATTKGIARSTDDGQNWEMLSSEEGVGIALD